MADLIFYNITTDEYDESTIYMTVQTNHDSLDYIVHENVTRTYETDLYKLIYQMLIKKNTKIAIQHMISEHKLIRTIAQMLVKNPKQITTYKHLPYMIKKTNKAIHI